MLFYNCKSSIHLVLFIITIYLPSTDQNFPWICKQFYIFEVWVKGHKCQMHSPLKYILTMHDTLSSELEVLTRCQSVDIPAHIFHIGSTLYLWYFMLLNVLYIIGKFPLHTGIFTDICIGIFLLFCMSDSGLLGRQDIVAILSVPLVTKQTDVLLQDLVKSQSLEIHVYSFPIALKFDRHLGSIAACKISEQYDHYNIQSCGFETSCDLSVRRLTT